MSPETLYPITPENVELHNMLWHYFHNDERHYTASLCGGCGTAPAGADCVMHGAVDSCTWCGRTDHAREDCAEYKQVMSDVYHDELRHREAERGPVEEV